MMTPSLWFEAARWRRAGHVANLWWRDDDAETTGEALDRLLRLAATSGTPLALAAVPAGDVVALGARLAGLEGVCVAQHGVDHKNRRTGPAAGEFPHDWSQEEVETALRLGWRRIEALPGALKVFVPPWNDIHPQLEASLAMQGYAGWSANGALPAAGELPRLDVHLDLMRWRGGARFRGRARLLNDLAREMRRRRLADAWDAPIGFLTHHLVHDAAAWVFLERFLLWSGRRPELRWGALPQLIRILCA